MRPEAKIVFGVVSIAVIFLIIGLVAWPSDKQAEKQVTSANSDVSTLVAAQTVYDFGTISMKDGKVSNTYSVTNTGAMPIMMEKVYTSCMCTEASLMMDGQEMGTYGMPGHGRTVPAVNKYLGAGKTAEIKVVFDPNAHGPSGIGIAERQITIETPNAAPLVLSLKANVTP